MELFEIGQICDAIQSASVSAGNSIIVQGEAGDLFYIIEDGKAIATKIFENQAKPVKVKDYAKGSFFGELALISNEPRQASITATVTT
jgi:cAMP-dependent protein kinase regulator